MREPTPLPGSATIPIPFPSCGPWADEGQSLQLGRFRQGFCSGNFYKTADNQLYLFLEIATWGGKCIKSYIPLRVPEGDEGASILHIHWADIGVRLQQDAYPPTHEDWQPLL